MTTNQSPVGTDVEALEVAFGVFNKTVESLSASTVEFTKTMVEYDAVKAAIDAYLAKLTSTKPEPSRIAELIDFLRSQTRSNPDAGADERAWDETIKECAYHLSHITAIEADRDRMREALERAEAAANVAMKYAEQERKVATVPATMEYQVGHVLTAIKSAALNPSKPGEG